MKINLPENVSVHETLFSNRILLKMTGLDGWDIIERLAEFNSMKVGQFAKMCDAQVYCDHIMIDSTSI